MIIVLTVAVFALILLGAWGGMRLMQRATGCACPSPETRDDQRSTTAEVPG